jgi:hypothetical protein
LILAGDAYPIQDIESLAKLISPATISGRDVAKVIKSGEPKRELFSEDPNPPTAEIS